MTRLLISGANAGVPVLDTALSGDGRYLAVALGDAGTTRQELQVRTLSINTPGTSLLTASHVAWSHDDPPAGPTPTTMQCGAFTITTDGQTALECVRYISW